MSSQPNRRKHTRIPINFRCELKILGDPSREVVGMAKNISYKGFLFTPDDPEMFVGQKCLVSLYLGERHTNPVIEAAARLAHKSALGMGFEIEKVSTFSNEHLKNLILFKSDDPDKIEEELA